MIYAVESTPTAQRSKATVNNIRSQTGDTRPETPETPKTETDSQPVISFT
ncbi:MAG: hypothetical protein LUC22_03445 [Prevotella sp.]|nr:hypothetical protein [Prevotella sp.]